MPERSCWVAREKNLFEVLSADESGNAKRWKVPSLAGMPSGKNTTGAAPRTGKLNTAGHLDEIEKAAYEEGFERGRAEGRQAGLRAAQDIAARMDVLLEHLDRPLKDISVETENALVKLAVDVARKLVNEDLQTHPEHVAGAIHQAVAALAATPRELKIHVHPDDVSLLKDLLNLSTDTRWKLIADANLAHGDCRVITESGQIDARLDTRQSNITNALLGENT